MREEKIRRMVQEGKLTEEEAQKLLSALERSRESSRRLLKEVGKKKRRFSRETLYLISIILVVCLAGGLSAGLYLRLRNTTTTEEYFEEGADAFQSGEYDEAIRLYEAGLEKEPDSSVGYNLLGMAYRFKYNEVGSPEYRRKEIEAFSKSLQCDPDYIPALVNLGMTLYQEGQKKEAATYLKKALEIYPQHPDRTELENIIREAESL